MDALLKTEFVGFPCKRGKVRDLYDLGDRLVMIATDRISAFDWVMPNPIPGKGKILTEMSLFWFNFLGVSEQLIWARLFQTTKTFWPDAPCW
jgi:phosphoribosylaminoimidazole-succinocarboxamide synthase